MSDVTQIQRWLTTAQKKGARYLIIGHDGFDMLHYPIYVMPNEDFWQKCPDKHGERLATISNTADEVYDLELDINLQLKEVRAWHPPVKVKQ